MGSYGGGVGDGFLWCGSYGVGPMVMGPMVVVWVMGPMVSVLWFGSYGVGPMVLVPMVWVVLMGNLK